MRMKEIRLNKELYIIEDIYETIKAFSSIAVFAIVERENCYFCCIKNSIYDEEETASEFENYLIDLSNKKHFKL